MCIGIISGIIAGILCAIVVWGFQCLWNVEAKKNVLLCMSHLEMYFGAINNDINCGQAFPSAELLLMMVDKVNFAFLYLDSAHSAIKRFNFLLHGRKNVLFQLAEIRKILTDLLTNWQLSSSEGDEWESRFLAFANQYQTSFWNIALYRIEVVTKLVGGRIHFREKTTLKIIDSIPLYEDGAEHDKIREEMKKDGR